MNGPEHYKEAEELLKYLDHHSGEGFDPGKVVEAAQVHATLALAAATAKQIGPHTSVTMLQWDEVLQ